MDPALPPVQKLVVPVTPSVSGNRSVSFRPTLTPGGLNRTLDRTIRETVSSSALFIAFYLLFYTTCCNTVEFSCRGLKGLSYLKMTLVY